MGSTHVKIERLDVRSYTIPTEGGPESDGTLEWDSTTIVVVHAYAAGVAGLGYSYTHRSAVPLIRQKLCELIVGRPAMDVTAAWHAMGAAVRNLGKRGIATMAISAVDSALWDLKARLLDLPLVSLLGQVRSAVPIYGSGGFTSYDDHRLAEQLGGWVAKGIPRVKMKVGRHPEQDIDRVRVARESIGPEAELMVDANAGYDRRQALAMAEKFAECGVVWYEEPVSSDDLAGLRFVRDRTPPGMAVTAGEYGFHVPYFRRMLEAEAVDVMQADATRCQGLTGFMKTAAVCAAFHVPLSAHTAPTLHMHLGCALSDFRHIEYFHDHVRIENMLFEGVVEPQEGRLEPNLERSGLGIRLREDVAAEFAD